MPDPTYSRPHCYQVSDKGEVRGGMRAWSALGEGGFQEETNLSLIALVTEKVLDLPTAVSRWPTCPWGDDRNLGPVDPDS